MRLALSLLVILLPFAAFGISEKKAEEGKELLQQIREKSNLRLLPAYRLKAKLTTDDRGKTIEGSYTMLWNGPDQWREEIAFPGFSEITVGGKGTVAIKRSLDFQPMKVYQILRMVGYGHDEMSLGPDEKISGTRSRKIDDVKAKCVELTEKDFQRELCADAFTGVLVRDRPFHDREFLTLGTKMFPKFMTYLEEGKPSAEVEVSELTAAPEFSASAFEVPAGATSKPYCDDPVRGRLVSSVTPQYPDSERRARREGSVYIYAVIATDGTLQHLHVISGTPALLDQAALNAVKLWRYEPYRCGDTPVEVESVLQVNFRLQR